MGRTFDYGHGYGEEVVVMPRGFPLAMRHGAALPAHYAMVGTACVAEGYPLYFDAVNEKGLGMVGLRFAGSAHYAEPLAGACNVAQFEFLPWLLGRCATLTEARKAIAGMRLVGTAFHDDIPAAALHWLVADRSGAIVVEAMADGLHVYENPVGVLTNEPPFPVQRFRLNDYRALTPRQPEATFSPALELPLYSRGMGTIGLPGDLSSGGRFVRAAFTRANARTGATEAEKVGQVFHILGTVEQVRGCCEVHGGELEYTIYTACWNSRRGIYYYTTCENRQISAVELGHEALDGVALARYPMLRTEQIRSVN